MAGGAGVAAPDGTEAGAALTERAAFTDVAAFTEIALDAQLVAADRGVVRIVPAQSDFAVGHRGSELTRCLRHREHRGCARRRRPRPTA